MPNIQTVESKVLKGNGGKQGFPAGHRHKQKEDLKEATRRLFGICTISSDCETCVKAELCQGCFEPLSSCRTCSVMRKCPINRNNLD